MRAQLRQNSSRKLDTASDTQVPPRLSSRFSQSLYGDVLPSLSQLHAIRKRTIEEIDINASAVLHKHSAQVSSHEHQSSSACADPGPAVAQGFAFRLDSFTAPTMNTEELGRIKRLYMSFLQEVAAIEGDSPQPNAAKTMFLIIAKRLGPTHAPTAAGKATVDIESDAACAEATSYFGSIPAARWQELWRLGSELQQQRNRSDEGCFTGAEFGSQISFRTRDSAAHRTTAKARSGAASSCRTPPVLLHFARAQLQRSVQVPPTQLQAHSEQSHFDHGGSDVGNRAVINNAEGNAEHGTNVLAAGAAECSSTLKWLRGLCTAHLVAAATASAGAHMTAEVEREAQQLADQLVLICTEHTGKQGQGQERLQMELFDLLGEGGVELMLEVTLNADRIAAANSTATQGPPLPAPLIHNHSGSVAAPAPLPAQPLLPGWEGNLSANQQRKLAQKLAQQEQQEQRDLQQALAMSSAVGEYNEGNGGSSDWLQQLGFGEHYLLTERALGLQGGLQPGEGQAQYRAMPEHWLEGLAAAGSREYHEQRGLPPGSERKISPGFEEVHLPAPKPPSATTTLRPAAAFTAAGGAVSEAKGENGEDEVDDGSGCVSISALDEWAQAAFPHTLRLNPMQSRTFPCAFHSSENMLVCAPTGAGKTNVAMLTLLQLVRRFIGSDGVLDRASLKAVYIAPMKALAQEVATKFSARLAPLGIKVREFTGDMQLTRAEVVDTQLLVSTPEKFDVTTRKGGDGSLGTLVSLIIIDEVHLLADERGAVIETIVARTQRYVETSQRLVRIVGLSATLPNYRDVAAFLRVNPRTGLHVFGAEYRPVPLEQTFVGVTEKQRVKRVAQMDQAALRHMTAALERGKQVMIFVHARKDTVRTAEAMADLCAKAGCSDLLENVHHAKYTLFKKQVDKSRSRELQQLFAKGLGAHHAGMLRPDRSLTEQLFEAGLIRVLCCTATLAWGVNLPAHTVIIKGTELYDPERGGFVDLSMHDVLQIFGRAGRPQYDTTGHAVLITPHASLGKYLGLLARQTPIESALVGALPDHLNAEVVNGTVTSIEEAAAWLSYTFLFVRMARNPLVYGLDPEEVLTDPQLQQKRKQLVQSAAETLDSCMMVRYDRRSGNLGVTNLGRIASHFYISHGTIEAFNSMLAPHLSGPDALHVLCSASEFDQLKARPEELPELDQLMHDSSTAGGGGGGGGRGGKGGGKGGGGGSGGGMGGGVQVGLGLGAGARASVDDTAGKVGVLLQGYLARSRLSSFTLQSDTNYVAQNGARICRALFEVCLKRGWSTMAAHYLQLCKCIDRRMLPGQSPLRQFQGNELPEDALARLEGSGFASAEQLRDLRDGREAGQLARNSKAGPRVVALARHLPLLRVEVQVQPITRTILRLALQLRADFQWTDRYHGGGGEPFWVWIEDSDNEFVYHSEYVLLSRKEVAGGEVRLLEVTIPVREPLPTQYFVRTLSDRWVGCERLLPVSFRHLLLPSLAPSHTDLLDAHPVPVCALGSPRLERLYTERGIYFFNPIQSQTFHTLYHSDRNVLVGAPTGSGKTVTAELALFRLLNAHRGCKAVYVAPMKALARERLADWRRRLGRGLGLRVLELTGDVTPEPAELRRADLLIVTPEKWDSISRGWRQRDYVQHVGLVVIDEIHLLGVDRGPVLEVIVSRMRFISAQLQREQPVRFVGLSTALANPGDLGDWLGCADTGTGTGTGTGAGGGTAGGAGTGVFNFRPSVRPVPIRTHIQGFPGQHYCPRMATMNKPAYAAVSAEDRPLQVCTKRLRWSKQ